MFYLIDFAEVRIMERYDYEGESRRIVETVRTRGLQSLEEVLLAIGDAILTLAGENPDKRKALHECHDSVAMAGSVVRRRIA